jgi:hypothetical protein
VHRNDDRDHALEPSRGRAAAEEAEEVAVAEEVVAVAAVAVAEEAVVAAAGAAAEEVVAVAAEEVVAVAVAVAVAAAESSCARSSPGCSESWSSLSSSATSRNCLLE